MVWTSPCRSTTPHVLRDALPHRCAGDWLHKGAYKGEIVTCTGKTNAGAFKGFAAGEVLFLGATGSLVVTATTLPAHVGAG